MQKSQKPNAFPLAQQEDAGSNPARPTHPMAAPEIHCPAIHVPEVVRATESELSPILSFLKGRPARRKTRRFPKGTTQRDGRLDFCKQGIAPDGLRAVLEALATRSPDEQGRPWLEHLLLGTNALGDEGAAVLGAALERGLAVQTLYLGCNAIRGPGVTALARGLAGHPHARALWLKRNPIGEEGLDALLDVLPRTQLRTLDLTNCALGDAGVARVVRALERPGVAVEHLFIGGNGLSDPTPLARWLADPACTLKSLFLSASRLGDAGTPVIFGALASNHRLHALDLSSNAIGASGLVPAAMRAKSPSLRWLSLGASPATAKLGEQFNGFGDDAVPSLAQLCASSLGYLVLAGTALTSRGATALLASARSLSEPPAIVFGPGIARSIRRAGKALSSQRAPVPEDIRRIASVYR